MDVLDRILAVPEGTWKRCDVRKTFLIVMSVLALAGQGAAQEAVVQIEPAKKPQVIRIEYSIFGGMENESYLWSLARDGESAFLTLEENRDGESLVTSYPVPESALSELEAYLDDYQPEGWGNLPEAGFIALDAPTHLITMDYDDGESYLVSDSSEIDGRMFRETRLFLESYLVRDCETFRLSFGSYEGGPRYRALLSDPSRVWEDEIIEYDPPSEEGGEASSYSLIMVFHGRVPGRTELTILRQEGEEEEETPLDISYSLEVDENFDVTCVEEVWREDDAVRDVVVSPLPEEEGEDHTSETP